ncbi:polymeric immunoglobulin receptor-like [Arapaima gigas]
MVLSAYCFSSSAVSQKPTTHTVATRKGLNLGEAATSSEPTAEISTSADQQTAGGTSGTDHQTGSTTTSKSSTTDIPHPGRTLDVLRHSAVVLVYLICTIIAATKTWICWNQK